MQKTKKSTKTSGSKLDQAKAKISDVGEDIEWLKLCVYARNGKGKTTFGASGPKPIVIDCNEKGTYSVRKMKDVKVFKVETWTDIDLAYWYLKAGKHDRQTVILDTVTSLATLCMKFVLGDESSRDPTKDPEMPTKRDWGKVGELMKTVIMNFRNLDMHVVFLAQERKSYVDDDSDEMPEVYPDLSASPRSVLTAQVNVIGRLFTKRVVKKEGKTKKKVTEYRMLLADHDTFVTKVNIQDHGLPGVMVNPTIPEMLALMAGEVKEPATKKKTTKKKGAKSAKGKA